MFRLSSHVCRGVFAKARGQFEGVASLPFPPTMWIPDLLRLERSVARVYLLNHLNDPHGLIFSQLA